MNSGLFGGSKLRGAANAPEAALAAMEIDECYAQIVGAEVRPQRVEEAELGVGRFPEQEIRQPLFAAGANEKIDVLLSVAAVACQQTGEFLTRRRPLEAPGCCRVGDGVARRIIDRDPQMQTRASG